jgi:hypothetical protein
MWLTDRRYCAGVAVERLAALLGYLAIFGSSLAGYAGLGPWIIAVAAIALASVSRAQYANLYERGRDLGLTAIIDSVMFRSLGNALVAAGVAYGGGWALRLI